MKASSSKTRVRSSWLAVILPFKKKKIIIFLSFWNCMSPHCVLFHSAFCIILIGLVNTWLWIQVNCSILFLSTCNLSSELMDRTKVRMDFYYVCFEKSKFCSDSFQNKFGSYGRKFLMLLDNVSNKTTDQVFKHSGSQSTLVNAHTDICIRSLEQPCDAHN